MRDLYRTVWDPAGVPFEVAPERAADLVLNKGWSNTAPVKKIAKKASKKVEENVPSADTTEAYELAGEPVDSSE